MQLRYMVHAEPVWRDRGDVRLGIRIPRFAGEREQWVEELWCRRLGDGRYQLCCIPFWLPDLALDSVIEPDRPESATRLALCRPSGRATLWAMFDEAGSAAAHEETAAQLGALGCLLEWSPALGLLAVDAATEAIAQAADAALRRRAGAGALRFGQTCMPHIATHRGLAAPHQGGAFVYASLDGRWAPLRWERLSAQQLGPAHFRLTDAPFFAKRLARSDEVETELEPRDMATNPIRRVLLPSRRLAVRVQIAPDQQDAVATVLAAAGALGCAIEWYASRLAVLDAPREAAARLRAFLDVEQTLGRLVYDDADLRRRLSAARPAGAASQRSPRLSRTPRRALPPRPRE